MQFASRSEMNKRYLYFTVFAAGLTTLAIELTASRLLGSVFGTSNLVWASIIGLILIYLTLGYYIGGLWADQSPKPKTFYGIVVWGAFSSGLVPFFARPILRMAADAFDNLEVGVLFGSFTVVLVLFIVPVTLLGTISPFAIRLAITNQDEAGRVSGRIYAISTLGSFIGTFLPVLMIIPLIGTTLTFEVFAGLLIIVGLIGIWRVGGWKGVIPWLWMPLLLAVLTWIWGVGPIKTTEGQIYETESSYNYIQVLDIDGFRYLRLNEGQGVHSIYHAEQIGFYGAWMQVLAAPFFNLPPYEPDDVKSLAIVGLAAGTVARQATAVYGEILIDGFEIDPEIIRVGQTYFNMTMPNLNAIAQDGRWGLVQSDERYSIISIDAYRPPYIPWHMTTVEFFQIVYDHLSEDGVLAINVGRAPGDRRLIDGLVGTIGTIFPSIYVMDVKASFNTIVYATVLPTSAVNLYNNMIALTAGEGIHPLLLESIQQVIMNMKPNPCEGSDLSKDCRVFTDDLAPVEWITNNMVLNYLLFGDMEELY